MDKYRVNIEANQDAPVFSKRLAKALTDKQMTQAELAKATTELAKANDYVFVEVSEPTISGWISGKKDGGHYPIPKLDSVISISKALDISIDYLSGVSLVQSTKENIKVACKTTGLLEENIETISRWLHSNPIVHNVLSFLINNEDFKRFMLRLYEYGTAEERANDYLKMIRTLHDDMLGYAEIAKVTGYDYDEKSYNAIIQTLLGQTQAQIMRGSCLQDMTNSIREIAKQLEDKIKKEGEANGSTE